MGKTFLTRISRLEQYDVDEKVINWNDDQDRRWENGVYKRIQVNSNAIFINGTKNQILFSKVKEIDSIKRIMVCDSVVEIKCSNDDLLKVNAIFPETIPYVKATFQPSIHPQHINIEDVISEIEKKLFISFYIINEEKFDEIKEALKINDRVVLINKENKIENTQYFDGSRLVIFDEKLNIKLSVINKSLEEILDFNVDKTPIGNREKSNNIKRIRKIQTEIEQHGYFRFSSFFTYHDTLYNNNLYRNWKDNEMKSKEITINQDKKNQNVQLGAPPKNLILYGPPGTGKTYNTKRKALEIITGRKVQESEINTLYENHKEKIHFVTFHQSFSYEQFVEGISVKTVSGKTKYFRKDGCFKKAVKMALNGKNVEEFIKEFPKNKNTNEYCDDKGNPVIFAEPVVLIIDEINRGNISKIFGELITLLEEDKRIGNSKGNEIIVTLPYSNKPFGVPPNLYIIGTMNTADRSLVQLDTALRRRFDFEEMMPKYADNDNIKWFNDGILEKVKVGDEELDFNLSNFLKKLNVKISKLYDREHQIGHSFLMNIENIEQLKTAWENRIMPLLQEYFYGNYEDLAKIIGEKSKYLIKDTVENETWDLNMSVKEKEFPLEFNKVYKFVIDEK